MAEFVTENNGVVTRTIFEDGKIIQKRVQDETPCLDINKALYNDAPGKFDRKANAPLTRIASIPMVAYAEIMGKMGIPPHRWFKLNADEVKLRNQYLNSSEYKYLRTAPGRL